MHGLYDDLYQDTIGYEPDGMPSNALERLEDIEAIRKYVNSNRGKNDNTKKLAQSFEDWWNNDVSWFLKTLPREEEWQEARRRRDAFNEAMGTPTPYVVNGKPAHGPPAPPKAQPPLTDAQKLLKTFGISIPPGFKTAVRWFSIGTGLVVVLIGTYYVVSAYYAIKLGKRYIVNRYLGPALPSKENS